MNFIVYVSCPVQTRGGQKIQEKNPKIFGTSSMGAPLGPPVQSDGGRRELEYNFCYPFQDRICLLKSGGASAMTADEDDGEASILTLLRRRWGLE